MKNITSYFLNFIFLFFISFLSNAGEVSIITKAPSKFDATNKVIIEVTISKLGVNGFAKFIQNLPNGIDVKAIETNAGAFSFNNGIIKIVWVELPKQDPFIVRYELIANSIDAPKIVLLNGKFTYLVGDKQLNAESTTIQIMNDNGTDKNLTTDLTREDIVKPIESKISEKSIEPTTNNSSKTELLLSPLLSKQENICDGITITRTMDEKSNGTFLVEVIIKKGLSTDFAKLEESIVTNVMVENINSQGAIFSYVDGKIKYLWTKMPEKDELKIVYKVVTAENFIANEIAINGLFSYVKNEETQKCVIPEGKNLIDKNFVKQIGNINTVEETGKITLNNNTQNTIKLTETTEPVISKPSSTTNTEPILENNAEEISKKNIEKNIPTSSVNKENTTKTISSTSLDALVYKIQVCASHKDLAGTYFKNLFQINEPILKEEHNGWNKYLINKSYSDLNTALTMATNLKSKIPGAFVVVYKNGLRVVGDASSIK